MLGSAERKGVQLDERSLDTLMRKLLAFVEVHRETDAEKQRFDRWKRQHAEVIDSILFSLFTIEAVSGDSIYGIVEKKAEYNGGLDAFFAETQKDLRYPKLARQYLVEGKVFVEFVIDKTGKLHNAKVIQGIGGGCDEAALDALKKRTKWSPAEVRGKVVSQKMVLPIAFNIK